MCINIYTHLHVHIYIGMLLLLSIFLVLHAFVCVNIVYTLYRASVGGPFYEPTIMI